MSRHPAEVGEYSWSYLFERGKHIRPRLFCELWRYLCPERPPFVELAFMVECVHVASLILDDLPLMDNASERRGWKTLHCMFSTRKALLIAHDVLELAWEVGKTSQFPQETVDWNRWVREKRDSLWMGQFLDLSRKGTLEEIAVLKTGTLFECITELVALSVDLDPIFWKSWGQTLGVLFQWVDDWNDREEDKAIQQRNAFNEAYEHTVTQYHTFWRRIVQGAGPGWWETPFGKFLWNYFTGIGINVTVAPLTSTQSLTNMFGPSPTISVQHPSSEHPALLFMTSIRSYMDKPVTTNMSFLWDIEEKEWDTILNKNKEFQSFLPLFRFI